MPLSDGNKLHVDSQAKTTHTIGNILHIILLSYFPENGALCALLLPLLRTPYRDIAKKIEHLLSIGAAADEVRTHLHGVAEIAEKSVELRLRFEHIVDGEHATHAICAQL